MSLGARATKGGAKGGAKDGKHAQDTRKSTDKTQTKEKVKPQATTEQLRMAHMIDRKSDDASDVRRMVLELMEMTCRTEEEVCSALHDSDNDMVAACNLLLEESQRIQGEWRTSEKKKKKPPAPAGNGELDPPRDPRSRSGPRPRRGSGERGGERGERGEGGWRGRGGTRGRGGARGARGGGARRPRPERACWDHTQPGGGSNNIVDTFPTTEDWDNEEWSGSLSDTKVLQVFTPSSAAQPADAAPDAPPTQEWEATEANGPLEAHIPTYTYHNSAHIPAHPHHPLRDQISSVSRQSPVSGAVAAPAEPQPPADTYHHPVHHQPMGMSGSLTAAQSQYLSQLTQQSQRHDNSVYTSNYGVYGNTDITSQRKPQRARVPPPSKIPSMAVEMPGGGEGGMFLDVQFGALEPDALRDNCTPKPQQQQPAPAPTASAAPAPAPASPAAATPPHEPPADTPPAPMPYQPPSTALSESLAVVEPTPVSAPATTEPTVTNTTSSLEAALSSMKQLSVSDAPPPQHQPQHHRPKTVGQQNVYAHHAVSHHPPVYGANVYAPQQVNSTNASLTGASAMSASAYPSSVTLTQYQPIINSYQTSSSAGPYGGSALYTAAPYTPYQPTAQPKQPPKETQQQQYDSSVASSNSLTSTTTQTQTSTAKVATTTVAGHGSGYAGGALYGAAATPAYAPYDDQLMRSTLPHHMGGYYEVGYGGRDATFGLSAGERFGRTDAASPQQVPAAALPPGYAYFAYQPPPTTYQYGVYPTYGGGSNVGGVGGVGGVSTQGKVSTYTQQQPYDAQDSYKPGGGYTGSGSKAGGGAAAELGNAIYAKPHPALNKVNRYAAPLRRSLAPLHPRAAAPPPAPPRAAAAPGERSGRRSGSSQQAGGQQA